MLVRLLNFRTSVTLELLNARVRHNPRQFIVKFPVAMRQLIARLLGRTKSDLPPFNFALNQFKAKKHWPPNLKELTEKQQYRFERKFKRRLRLKSIKPTWNKWTKIVQWNLIAFVTVYGVLFADFRNDPMNPRPGEQPFMTLRNWMWGKWDGLWTHTSKDDVADRRSDAVEDEAARPARTQYTIQK